jgi:hypothetical protein
MRLKKKSSLIREQKKKAKKRSQERKYRRDLRKKTLRREAKLELGLKAKAVTSETLEAASFRPKKEPKALTPLHAEANELYRQGEYEEALEKYTEALADLEAEEARPDERLLSNRAACYIALKRYPEAVEDADRAIKAKFKFFKAHYRRACAMQAMQNLREARRSLRHAMTYCPDQRNFFRPILQEMRTAMMAEKKKPAGPYAPLVPAAPPAVKEEKIVERSLKKQRPNALGGHKLIIGDAVYSCTLRSEDYKQALEMHVQTVGTGGTCLFQINTGSKMPFGIRKYNDHKMRERTRAANLLARNRLLITRRKALAERNRIASFDPFREDSEAAEPQGEPAGQEAGAPEAPATAAAGAVPAEEEHESRRALKRKRRGKKSLTLTAFKKRRKIVSVKNSAAPVDPETGELIIPIPLPKTPEQIFEERKEAKLKEWRAKRARGEKCPKPFRTKKREIRMADFNRKKKRRMKPLSKKALKRKRRTLRKQRTETGVAAPLRPKPLGWMPERAVGFVWRQSETELMPLEEAVARFERIFYEKTGVKWANRQQCRYSPRFDIYFYRNSVATKTTR